MASPYHFRTDWDFVAPVDRVWDIVLDARRYPKLWKDFRRVTLRRGDGESVGSIIECEVRGALPYSPVYTLEVTAVDRPRMFAVRSTGDLVGTGRWEFIQTGQRQTHATYFWDVATTNPALNVLAPMFRRLFASNHDRVMARGYAALKAVIESPGG